MKKYTIFAISAICFITLFSVPVKAVQSDNLYGSNDTTVGTPSDTLPQETIGQPDLLAQNIQKDQIISLKVPSIIDFWMDQYGLKWGRQVYSQEYKIKNNGSNRILVEFFDIQCIVADDIISVDDGWSDEEVRKADDKVIKLILKMSNGDVINVTDQPSSYQLNLGPKEEITFTIDGCMSESIHNQWETGEVSIEMVYAAEIEAEANN